MTAYATTLEVFEYLGVDLSIPDYGGGVTTPEEVTAAGTTATATSYYLDHIRVIDNTFTISYGASSTATQTSLTETTDYTIDLDIGKITTTSAGASAIGANGVYATYKYNDNFTDSKVSDIISRKTKLIDGLTHQSWQTTTLNEKEEHMGRGKYDRIYRPENQPVLFAYTQLNGALDASSTSMVVDSTTNFTAGDYVTIESEVIGITTVSSSTAMIISRGAYGTTAAVHADDSRLANVVVEVSNAPVGYSPTFNVLSYDDEFAIDSNSGAIQVLHINPENSDIYNGDVYPEHHVFNRLRMTYRSGSASVPSDIKELCILMTAKELFNASMLNSLARGTNGFTSDAIDKINEDIKVIVNENKLLLSSRG